LPFLVCVPPSFSQLCLLLRLVLLRLLLLPVCLLLLLVLLPGVPLPSFQLLFLISLFTAPAARELLCPMREAAPAVFLVESARRRLCKLCAQFFEPRRLSFLLFAVSEAAATARLPALVVIN
jgi:hypothetical protein